MFSQSELSPVLLGWIAINIILITASIQNVYTHIETKGNFHQNNLDNNFAMNYSINGNVLRESLYACIFVSISMVVEMLFDVPILLTPNERQHWITR